MSLDNGYVSSDYLKNAATRLRAFKDLTYCHMQISEGDTVVDVGCGPGVDTIPLAELVGSRGRVIGVDTDEKMLRDADQAAEQSELRDRITHQLGKAQSLPIDNNRVASCRAERLLQVLPADHADAIMREMLRVTKTGGRIVLADTDWVSASVDFSDSELERRLMTFFALRMRPDGIAGRRLFALCQQQGLTEIMIDIVPMLQLQLADTPFGPWLINTARTEDIITEDEGEQWLDELQRREEKQQFYACINMVIVSGTKHK